MRWDFLAVYVIAFTVGHFIGSVIWRWLMPRLEARHRKNLPQLDQNAVREFIETCTESSTIHAVLEFDGEQLNVIVAEETQSIILFGPDCVTPIRRLHRTDECVPDGDHLAVVFK